MEPRTYQQEAIDYILGSDKNILRSNFTGTGKTLEQVQIVRQFLNKGRVWVIAPKGYLLEKLMSFFPTESTVLKGASRVNWSKKTYFM